MTDLERIKDRFEHWHGLADARHIAEGKSWYREAHAFAQEVATTYDVPLYKVCGVIAALSPAVWWDLNKRQAENLVQAYADGGELEAVVVSTYGRQGAKARSILRDGLDSYDVQALLGKRAFKTVAFYWNILRYPDTLAVTIDQHIIAAADFTEYFTQSARWCYDLLSQAICELAATYGYKPFELQAILWITYKDLTDARSPEEKANLPF